MSAASPPDKLIKAKLTKETLTKKFNRIAATALLLVVPFGLAACNKKGAEAPKAHHAAHHATHRTAPAPPPPVVFAAPANAAVPAVNAAAEGLCLYGCPTGTPASDRVISRSIYILSNNGATKFADWVAYEVTDKTIGGTRERSWHRDPELPKNESLSARDYKDVEDTLQMERGHQAPLASLTGSPDWAEADDLSNITPQAKDLNEGPWEHLENAERKIAVQDKLTVYSVTGPLYERDMPGLPHSHLTHKIPSGYWKVVAVQQGGETSLAAFILDQKAGREENFCVDAVTELTVENRAHLRLFPHMPQAEREKTASKPGKLLPALGCAP